MKRSLWYFTFIFAALSFNHAFALSIQDSTLVYESYTFEKESQYAAAISKMTQVLSTNPENYFVHLRLGYLFGLNKQNKNATDHYEAAHRLSPTSLEPLLSLSELYIRVEDYPKAATISEKLLQHDPNNYYGMQRLITAQIKLGQKESALKKARVAVQFYPSDPVFLEQKGYLEIQSGQTNEGKQTLSQLLLLNPNNTYARSILGQ